MPILVMALLALVVFGLIGILLTVAVVLEHKTLAGAAQGGARPVTADATSFLNPTFDKTNFDKTAGEATPKVQSPKEKAHEHACT